jgi:hypothetical protein
MRRKRNAFLMQGCEKGRREDLTIEKSHILVYNIQ